MKTGFIGLGKMGGNMVRRLQEKGEETVVFDLSEDAVREAVSHGATAAASIEDLCTKLPEPRQVWIMVPSGDPVDSTISALKKHLSRGDIIIDGGNSNWKDSRRRAGELAADGIRMIDCGTSGGVWGLTEGYCLMYGGEKEACERMGPVFTALAPENGHQYCGTSGAGHYVKMVHNGIEYGMMQAYAEGFELLQKSPFSPNLPEVAQVWRHGSVIRSWLLDLTADALKENPDLQGIKSWVEDSGEGRWTVDAAVEQSVPAPVITAALFARFQSRDENSFAMKILSAMRNQFGGHRITRE